jgi:oligopeptide/dipeptide ABC transporter ATP-binding protein
VRLPVIPGQPPNLIASPPGCRFAPRCAHRQERCATEAPPTEDVGNGHSFACWYPAGEGPHGG